uniref:hypothetical protein n=1 Tax=Flavilitoribacter nigricans TaxID=70997 RepID=UPI003742FE49
MSDRIYQFCRWDRHRRCAPDDFRRWGLGWILGKIRCRRNARSRHIFWWCAQRSGLCHRCGRFRSGFPGRRQQFDAGYQ